MKRTKPKSQNMNQPIICLWEGAPKLKGKRGKEEEKIEYREKKVATCAGFEPTREIPADFESAALTKLVKVRVADRKVPGKLKNCVAEPSAPHPKGRASSSLVRKIDKISLIENIC